MDRVVAAVAGAHGDEGLGPARVGDKMTLSESDSGSVPADVAARIVRAMDRSPSTVVSLIDSDLRIRWISHSATWITGTDPSRRTGANSLERIHPDDVERLIHGLDILRVATPNDAPTAAVPGPLRYRFQRFDGRWVVMEAMVHNLLDDPLVEGLLVEARPVEDGLDGVGHVVDLLTASAPLQEVLAACAGLVPAYLGPAAVVALLDSGPVVGAWPPSLVHDLAVDDRWWRGAVDGRETVTPSGLEGFPADLAAQARAGGYHSAWVLPLVDDSTDEPIGCVVVWLQLEVEFSIAIDESLRQTRRLATLVIGEERRRHTLRHLAATDPLTGLANRSALRRRLDQAPGDVTVALVDLDDFKPVNDTYGHEAGDTVLQTVAERLTATVRADDLVVRLGGDEFAVAFADQTQPNSAAQLAARLVEVLQDPIALPNGPKITVGASVGLATATADNVIQRADAALYDAKRTKRRPTCDPAALGPGPHRSGSKRAR